MTNLPAKIKERLPVVNSQGELQAQVLNVFDRKAHNVLIPDTINFGPQMEMSMQVLKLDDQIDEKAYRSNDFWTRDKKKYHLTADAIKRIGCAANILEKEVEKDKHYDSQNKLDRVEVMIKVKVRSPAGNLLEGVGSYEWNVANDLEDPMLLKKEWDDKINKMVKTDEIDMERIAQRRRNAIQLAETGAMARAIYDALGFVYKSYSRNDISKPFIVPTFKFRIDVNDPGVRKLITEKALSAKSDVYGPNQNRQPVEAESQVINGRPDVDTDTGEVKEPAPTAAQSEQPAPEPPPDQPEPVKQTRADFESDWGNANSNDRAKEIRRLAKLAGHDITTTTNGKPQEAPEKWSKDTQKQWLVWLAQKAGIISG